MKLEKVSLALGGRPVLENFSLALEPGSVTCLMGRSGCGKTTVLNLMLGFLTPDAGEISGFRGLPTGVVFQEDRLIEHMNAWDNVLLAAAKGVTRKEVDRAFAQVLLDPGPTPARRLSGGQRRRMAVVRALLARPRLLLLDEPFKGLDPDSLAHTAAFIRQHRQGATTVLCAHEREEALLLGAERFVAL